jgi:hypothetical protein
MNATANVEAGGQPQEAWMYCIAQVGGDLVRHRLMKRAAIAKRPDVEFQGFQLDTQPVGNVFELERREIRLAGFWAQAGEFRQRHADGVVALRCGIREGFERAAWACSHLKIYFTLRSA